MQILNNLFGTRADDLKRALDRTTLRHSLLSANLANLNTPGYKRQDVDFGVELGREMERGAPIRTETGGRRQDNSSVDLEQEVVGLAETELRYQALTDITTRYFAGLKSVIREGK